MKRILVAIDFSETTTNIIKYATEIACVIKAKIYLTHIEVPDPDFVGYDTGPQCVQDNVAKEAHHHKELLEDYKKHIVEAGATASVRQIQGATVSNLVNLTNQLECDMIIVGSHQHGFFHHLIHGSITDSLLTKSPVPVIVYPPHAKNE